MRRPGHSCPPLQGHADKDDVAGRRDKLPILMRRPRPSRQNLGLRAGFAVTGIITALTGPVLIGLAMFVLGCTAVGFWVHANADTEPVVRITHTGILDRRLAPAAIPWTGVKRAHQVTRGDKDVVRLALHESHAALGDSRVDIDLTWLDGSSFDVMPTLVELIAEAHPEDDQNVIATEDVNLGVGYRGQHVRVPREESLIVVPEPAALPSGPGRP